MAEQTIQEQVTISKFKKALFNLAMNLAAKGQASWTAAEANQQIEEMSDEEILQFVQSFKGE